MLAKKPGINHQRLNRAVSDPVSFLSLPDHYSIGFQFQHAACLQAIRLECAIERNTGTGIWPGGNQMDAPRITFSNAATAVQPCPAAYIDYTAGFQIDVAACICPETSPGNGYPCRVDQMKRSNAVIHPFTLQIDLGFVTELNQTCTRSAH